MKSEKKAIESLKQNENKRTASWTIYNLEKIYNFHVNKFVPTIFNSTSSVQPVESSISNPKDRKIVKNPKTSDNTEKPTQNPIKNYKKMSRDKKNDTLGAFAGHNLSQRVLRNIQIPIPMLEHSLRDAKLKTLTKNL